MNGRQALRACCPLASKHVEAFLMMAAPAPAAPAMHASLDWLQCHVQQHAFQEQVSQQHARQQQLNVQQCTSIHAAMVHVPACASNLPSTPGCTCPSGRGDLASSTQWATPMSGGTLSLRVRSWGDTIISWPFPSATWQNAGCTRHQIGQHWMRHTHGPQVTPPT
jgi:hypothetical protein